MKSICLFTILAALTVIAIGQENIEMPAKQEREELVVRNGYALSYNVAYELSSFVAYKLTKEMAIESAETKGKNDEDEGISTGTADKKDYKKSGYVMGQLIPSENFATKPEIAEQLYLMSNIAPMKPGFYTMSWKNVEKLIRAWAIQDDTDFYIAAGPVLTDAPFGTIGDNKVSVPERYYKVVLDLKNNRAVGFIFKNSYVKNVFYNFAMPVDKVEEITGIDFFVALDDEKEEKLENTFNKDDWDWEAVENVYGE